MISASRAGVSCNPARRARRSASHSGMVHSGNEAHGLDEGLPCAALTGQHFSAGGSQAVETASPLSRLLHPASLQPAAFLESVEKGIERRDVKLERAVRARLNQLADLVAVPRTGVEH